MIQMWQNDQYDDRGRSQKEKKRKNLIAVFSPKMSKYANK